MKVAVAFDKKMRMIGTNEDGLETIFDAKDENGEQSGASPMQVFLQSMGACQSMDIVSILKKKRKDITDFRIEMEAERSDEHPKYITKIKMLYKLISTDASEKDLLRCIELSQDKYCGVMETFKRADTEFEWEYELINP